MALLLTGCDDIETRLKAKAATASQIVFTSGTTTVITNAVVLRQDDIVRMRFPHFLDSFQ